MVLLGFWKSKSFQPRASTAGHTCPHLSSHCPEGGSLTLCDVCSTSDSQSETTQRILNIWWNLLNCPITQPAQSSLVHSVPSHTSECSSVFITLRRRKVHPLQTSMESHINLHPTTNKYCVSEVHLFRCQVSHMVGSLMRMCSVQTASKWERKTSEMTLNTGCWCQSSCSESS